MDYDSFLGNLYLSNGGKDLIVGHSVRVYFPHRTLQAFYVSGADSIASISCFHCGLQLQSIRRGGVKATKRTQVQVARVALSEEFRILLKHFLTHLNVVKVLEEE